MICSLSATGKQFLTFDVNDNKWSRKQNITEARNYHGVAVLNNIIYLVGTLVTLLTQRINHELSTILVKQGYYALTLQHA